MAMTRRPVSQLRKTIQLVEKHGSVKGAARAAKMPYSTFRFIYDSARESLTAALAPTDPEAEILRLLRRAPASTASLSSELHVSPKKVETILKALHKAGNNVQQFGELWSVEKAFSAPPRERVIEIKSDKNGLYRFGLASDAHLGSKYSREDVLDDLYNIFEREGIRDVLNAGNWIDGECGFNRQDLKIHGLEPQVEYLVEKFPERKGLRTLAVWGEDHEGWFARREAIDMGRFTEQAFRRAGRTDWTDLGFMEARIDLVHGVTGQRASLVLQHPGGGSSYAVSYRPQKIVESLQGGEKPAVLVIGHYHKMSCNMFRNVWAIQSGCTQDQTPFMRKKGLDAHVGGGILGLEQDPATGAITRCVWDQRNYFVRGYYNDRWSATRQPVLPKRMAS